MVCFSNGNRTYPDQNRRILAVVVFIIRHHYYYRTDDLQPGRDRANRAGEVFIIKTVYNVADPGRDFPPIERQNQGFKAERGGFHHRKCLLPWPGNRGQKGETRENQAVEVKKVRGGYYFLHR